MDLYTVVEEKEDRIEFVKTVTQLTQLRCLSVAATSFADQTFVAATSFGEVAAT